MIAVKLRAAVETALGERVVNASSVSGGDINQAYALTLSDGRRVFLKTHPHSPPGMFATEARGLEFLREARGLRIPDVLAFSPPDHDQAFLLLEFIASARPQAGFDEALGRGLASLHQFGAPSFGFPEPNFIGRLPQANDSRPTWAEFYRDQRLAPQIRAAVDAKRAPDSLRRDFDRLFDKLPELAGPPEAPARLHGDLWGGNLHVDERGAPCLIDPAVYGGHREMDLAMMRLFGGFGARVFSAYEETTPLAPGHRERIALYQLYPLLVHVNLFGGSYLTSVQSALANYV